MGKIAIRLGHAISDLGCWLDRKGCAMAEMSRMRQRRPRPLRFENDSERMMRNLAETSVRHLAPRIIKQIIANEPGKVLKFRADADG